MKDEQFPDILRDVFTPVTRVPLYFCANCPAPTCYRVVGETAIRCIAQKNSLNEENSFADLPVELPRRRIGFQRIPSQIDGLLTLEDEVGLGWFDDAAKKILRRYRGKEADDPWDLPFSQFGGQPLFWQGHWEITCPNRACPASKIGGGAFEEPFYLKELAVIEGDCSSEIERIGAQIAYHICWLCRTIHAQYRCD